MRRRDRLGIRRSPRPGARSVALGAHGDRLDEVHAEPLRDPYRADVFRLGDAADAVVTKVVNASSTSAAAPSVA